MVDAEVDRKAIAAALGLPADAETGVIVERIGALRLVRAAETLDQVRRELGMTADASPLACAVELCRRLPDEWHQPAVLALRVVEVKERERTLRVGSLMRDALKAAEGGAST